MSAATSPTSAESYGVERVCRILETPRSTYYAHLELVPISRPPPERRGPKPKVSDDELLEYIEADLRSSPFHAEGHRKVWARLRVLRDVRISAKRVLRVMRENKLLSPHRSRQGSGKAITTARTERHVGYRRHARPDRRGRLGLDLRRCRALER